MNRLEWILSGILGLLLLIGLILAALILWPRPNPGDLTPRTTRDAPSSEALIQATSVYQGQTAQTAYRQAAATAQEWASDAKLMRAAAAWPEGSQFTTGEESWEFIFYSASKEAIALIAVVEDKALLINDQRALEKYQLPETSVWQIDSPAVVQQLLQNSGQTFIQEQGSATLLLTLTGEEDAFYWEAALFKAETGQSKSIRLDAGSGLLLP